MELEKEKKVPVCVVAIQLALLFSLEMCSKHVESIATLLSNEPRQFYTCFYMTVLFTHM
jgi:hypothetical protein